MHFTRDTYIQTKHVVFVPRFVPERLTLMSDAETMGLCNDRFRLSGMLLTSRITSSLSCSRHSVLS